MPSDDLRVRGDTSTRRRILWATNIAAPYRGPVWESMARDADLTVVLLESDRQRRREGRRGADWSPLGLDGVPHRTLRTVKVRRRELSLYVALELGPLLGRRPDAILLGGWESPAYWQMLLLARIRGVRAVGFYESTLHTNRFRGGPVAAARAWFFRHLDAVVVPGEQAEAALLQFGVSPEKIHRGFNAVDVVGIADRAATRRLEAGTRSDGHRYVFVGQLIERKQPGVLLRAFAAVRRDGDSLCFVGDGDLRPELEAEVARLDLRDRVTFTGPVDNEQTVDVMAACDTIVLPSSEEVWGLVVNEGLAAGLHAVVSETSGVATSVAGMRGVFVAPPDQDGMARAMVASRDAHTGPVDRPEILAHTPDAFGHVFLRAMEEEA